MAQMSTLLSDINSNTPAVLLQIERQLKHVIFKLSESGHRFTSRFLKGSLCCFEFFLSLFVQQDSPVMLHCVCENSLPTYPR
jgi:hypothetical protein